MNRKIIFLFSALLLPGLIYLFLRHFGKNEFDIPLFYQNSADSLNSVCHTRYTSPYAISDSVLMSLDWHSKKATVFLFNKEENKELNRLSDTFDDREFDLVKPSVLLAPIRYERTAACAFFVHNPWDIVLVDEEKRIRGYYKSNMREEMDRLILEMKILLKKY